MCSLAICAHVFIPQAGRRFGARVAQCKRLVGAALRLHRPPLASAVRACVRPIQCLPRPSISAPSDAERSSCSRRSAARLGTDARMRLLCAPRGRCNERDKSRKRMRLLCDADASTPMADAFVRSAAFFATRTAVAAGACMRAPHGHVQDGGSAPPLKRSLSDGGAAAVPRRYEPRADR